MADQHFKPHPKAQKKPRRKNRDEMALLRERTLRRDARCVVCAQRPSESIHHVVPRGDSGEDVAENLLGVCGSGTTRCHGDIEEWRGNARSRMRAVIEGRGGVRQYVLDRVGEAWLERHYPLAEEPDAAGLLSERESMRGDAPPRPSRLDGSRSNWWGRPVPGWASKQDLDSLFLDCLLILQRMDAPVVKKGSGEAYSVLELVFRDFIDRYREYLPKGEAA